MNTLGSFVFADMTIEVESLRNAQLGFEVFWLLRTRPNPRLTVAVRRPSGIAVANRLAVDPIGLDTALAEFLKRRSDSS
ncbi:hypothetical protein [Glycomyces buryatensis]|uniref:Uncharacterized protein n=1 Tax=Glycomyces buryatensis TaxID=2570927 RepID=A0A4S8Q396_9ACTN|nr:hypothetical protein [Glycomyces buryatensis]THV38643.1 hypothetical protein FAB82_19635 [Glycomyces buryatensis]